MIFWIQILFAIAQSLFVIQIGLVVYSIIIGIRGSNKRGKIRKVCKDCDYFDGESCVCMTECSTPLQLQKKER